jgi:hypothetical protein
MGIDIRLEHLVHNTRLPGDVPLPCLCLIHERGGSRVFVPSFDTVVREGDRLLFAGRGTARREMLFTLQEPTAIVGYATGRPQPRGAIMRRLTGKRTA